jgi:hypothetical protein
MKDNKDLKPEILSYAITNEQFKATADKDTTWAAASVMFVFFYLIFHLKSSMMALHSIMIILLSFPMTSILNEVVIGNTFFTTLH